MIRFAISNIFIKHFASFACGYVILSIVTSLSIKVEQSLKNHNFTISHFKWKIFKLVFYFRVNYRKNIFNKYQKKTLHTELPNKPKLNTDKIRKFN